MWIRFIINGCTTITCLSIDTLICESKYRITLNSLKGNFLWPSRKNLLDGWISVSFTPCLSFCLSYFNTPSKEKVKWWITKVVSPRGHRNSLISERDYREDHLFVSLIMNRTFFFLSDSKHCCDYLDLLYYNSLRSVRVFPFMVY